MDGQTNKFNHDNSSNIDLEIQLIPIPEENRDTRYKFLCVCNSVGLLVAIAIIIYYYTK